ncbi:MAG: transcription termination factor Rho, partial [Nocardioidaceae bacterium]
MLLPELKRMAGGLGIKGAGAMRKSQLVDAIKAAQAGARPSGESDQTAVVDRTSAPVETGDRGERSRRQASPGDGADRDGAGPDEGRAGGDAGRAGSDAERAPGGDRDEGRGEQGRGEQGRGEQGRGDQTRGDQTRGDDGRNDDDGSGRGRNRRRRGRDRSERTERTERPERVERPDRGDRSPRSTRNEPDTSVHEDDVLVPAAGILDVLDNYAFVRTSGYLPGTEDVYVSLSMVRKFGLRRGDAVTGQVRQPREGDRREKFNPLVRIDTINGADPEAARGRVEFQKLTPLYASERLRLETDAGNLIGRVIDIAAPIGKGQRGLIVSPSKAGKTMIMKSIANSITSNNPECHLMVVLVDERPEEVTDFERSVKGEVISSTFDRPASDHTAVAELAIERAKRLVELGHDVVVLLDGITRLGRAYNLAAPASGRILSGGVDSAALYPP